MRFLISVVVAALTAMTVNAQTQKETELKKLLEQIAALQARIDKFPPDYAKASAQAAKESKPLVMFVGVGSMRQIKGAVVGQQDYGAIFDESPPAIVIALPDGNGWINWRETLPATATDEQIQAMFTPKAVSRSANPFDIRSYKSQPPVGLDGNSLLPVGSIEAMDELNAQRARKGIPPFIRDDLLTIAAARAAAARAASGNAGHTSNDFAYVPSGGQADAAGCGAWAVGTVTTDGWTFGTCCADDRGYRYGGAAWVMGSDGRRYMHLYVRR